MIYSALQLVLSTAEWLERWLSMREVPDSMFGSGII